MQITSSQYDDLATGYVRPLSWDVRVSFTKIFDPDIEFFTLDTSLLDGVDVLSPDDSSVIQPSDKFEYQNYDERLISMEWEREELVPYSVTQAFGNVTLNNYDNYFTRGSDSPIDQYLLPKRPIRLLAGFDGLNLPQFVGLTTEVPNVNRASRMASVPCIDFLSYLFDRPLDTTVMYQDLKTDAILENLLTSFGLIPGQYDLDEAFNEIAFFYVEKGQKFGDIVKQLMQAELGSLSMNEAGVIVFRNRLRSIDTPVVTFTNRNIIDYSVSDEGKIINVVEIKADVREVQELQVVYSSIQPLLVPAGQTMEYFFNFEDPVTTIDTVDGYVANTAEDGSGTDITTDVVVNDTDLFSTAVKVVFENTGIVDAFITELNILGTPARVSRQIYLREDDADSIEQFEEKTLVIENNYIQSKDAANSLALSLINYYKSYANTIELEVKGNYALQIGDTIAVNVDSIDADYRISKIVNILSGARFTQRLTGKIYNIPSFFILDQSLLNGTDVLAI